MEEKKVSFGDVSIHSSLWILISYPQRRMTSLIFTCDWDRRSTLEEHSVWMNMRRKSPSPESVAKSKYGDAKLCARLPVLSRFDRVQRSLRVVKNGEKHLTQIKQNFTEFLQGLNVRTCNVLQRNTVSKRIQRQ